MNRYINTGKALLAAVFFICISTVFYELALHSLALVVILLLIVLGATLMFWGYWSI